ncbi:MAG: hypothetical protein ACK5C0_09590 [Candidatus Kapaibacterium sp.]|jgi:hypothetical protein
MKKQYTMAIVNCKEKMYIYIGILIVYVFTVSKSIRLPNDWAEAHWLIGYQFGFIKRGLPGELLRNLTPPQCDLEIVISVVSLVIFTVMSIAIVMACKSILCHKKSFYDDFAILTIFMSSSYVVMSAHLMGYYDHLLILLVFVAFLSKDTFKYPIIPSFVMTVSFLIHETTLVLSLPIVIFSYVLQRDYVEPRKKIYHIVGISFLPFVLLLMIILKNKYFYVNATEIIRHLSHYTFIDNDRSTLVAYAIFSSFGAYLKLFIYNFIPTLILPSFLLKVGIPLFSILYIVWKKISVPLQQKKKIFLIYTFIVVSPLVLHAIATDTSRIWNYPLVVAFMGYLTMKRNDTLNNRYDSIFVDIVLAISCFLNLYIDLELMDNLVERYEQHVRIISCVIMIGFVIGVRKFYDKKCYETKAPQSV